ncbi:hypothetical protein GGH16_003903, partial [Coemansia sp. RSA 560]
MVTKPKSTIIHTSIDKLGFKNPNNIARLQKITEKVQDVTVFAQDIHALAVLKHLDNADALDTKNLMSHLFIVQCFLLSGFDNDIKAIELAFKDDNISKTVYDEQISDRKKVHKALREYITNVLPKDVVDTGADAGLHPDLIQVLSTYSPEFARIGGTINDRIDQHPEEHLWAMLRLNEVRCKHDMSTINILPFDNGFSPKF